MPSIPLRRPATILQVVPALDTGGAERTTIDIVAAIVGRGDRALVATAGGRLVEELRAAGGELLCIPAAAKSPAVMATNVWRLADLIRRQKVDIVHARSRAPAWSTLAACRLTGAPFVTTYHGSYGERGRLKRFYNSVMARGDVVIANSSYTAGLIARRHSSASTRIRVIHRGTDLALFDPSAVDEERRQALRHAWGISGDERIVLQLARLTGWKGQGVLIDAMRLPPLNAHGNVAVILAGDEQGRGEYRAALQARIDAVDLGAIIRLVGHCADVPAALTLADVAVIASTKPEAFGRTAIEAAAMGVPVVATALGATSETVLAPPDVDERERTGWLIPADAADALASAIGSALAMNSADRAAMTARARSHAERFSVAAMQEQTLAVYEALLTGRDGVSNC